MPLTFPSGKVACVRPTDRWQPVSTSTNQVFEPPTPTEASLDNAFPCSLVPTWRVGVRGASSGAGRRSAVRRRQPALRQREVPASHGRCPRRAEAMRPVDVSPVPLPCSSMPVAIRMLTCQQRLRCGQANKPSHVRSGLSVHAC